MKLKVINNGKEIILQKMIDDKKIDDYVILDRSNGNSYRVLNGIKRSNKNLTNFGTKLRLNDIECDDEIIKMLINIIVRSTEKRNVGSIINELNTPRALTIEKWLKVGYDKYNKLSYFYYPDCNPNDISKKIRNDLINKELLDCKYFINEVSKVGDSIKQIIFYDIYVKIEDFMNKPCNYRLREYRRSYYFRRNNNLWDIRSNYNIICKTINTIMNYNCNVDSFLNYISMINFTENLDGYNILENWCDYMKMSFAVADGRTSKINKYPKNLLTEHHKIIKDYNNIKEEFDELQFKKNMDKIKNLEYDDGDYCVLVPNKIYDIQDEALQQHNCVRSYISDVVDGKTNILFIRKSSNKSISLLTVELDNFGNVVQVYRGGNENPIIEDYTFINKWCKVKDLVLANDNQTRYH